MSQHPKRSSIAKYDRIRSKAREWEGIVICLDLNLAGEVVLVVSKTSPEVAHEPDAVLFADEVECLSAGPFKEQRDEDAQMELGL